jgi:hypothetical protein
MSWLRQTLALFTSLLLLHSSIMTAKMNLTRIKSSNGIPIAIETNFGNRLSIFSIKMRELLAV